MNRYFLSGVSLAFALLSGCEVVRSARETQDRLAPIGAGEEIRVADLPDLTTSTLDDLVRFAQAHRPAMRSAEWAVEDARLALKEIAADAPLASSTPWNAAKANASFGASAASDAVHFEDLGGTHKGKLKGSLSLDLLVWDFGRQDARARAQCENVLAAELALAKTGYDVFEDVATTYFTCRREVALRSVAEMNLTAVADRLAQAEDRLRVGEAMPLDVTRARLDLAQARESLVAASNAVVTAEAEFLAALGVAQANRGGRFVSSAFTTDPERLVQAFPVTGAPVAEFYETGRTNAPAVAIARARLRAASAQVDYAVANLMPELSASVGLSWTDPRWYWNWGASAVQSLFTGFRKTTAVDRARVALESAAADVATAEQALAREVELAVAARDNAFEQLEAAGASVRQAEENLNLVTARVQIGEASRIDQTDAQAAFAAACGNRIRAFYAGQMAEATLYRLQGVMPQYVTEKRSE